MREHSHPSLQPKYLAGRPCSPPVLLSAGQRPTSPAVLWASLYNTQIKLFRKRKAEKKARVREDSPSPRLTGLLVYLFSPLIFHKMPYHLSQIRAAFYYYCCTQFGVSFIFRGNFISICLKPESNEMTRIMFSSQRVLSVTSPNQTLHREHSSGK